MSTLLTHIAISDGKIKRSSLEVLSRCKQLADETEHSVEAVILHPRAADFAEEVKTYGPSNIYLVQDDIFDKHRNSAVLKGLSHVIEQAEPMLIAFGSTESTKDILGALGAQHDAAVLSDVSEFELIDGGIQAKRPVMAAKILANTEAHGDLVILSVRSGAYDVVENPSDPEITDVDFGMGENEIQATIREIIGSSGDKVDLTEAETIVAAGRGVKDDDGTGTQLISELAELLNAAIGSSRALTEAGIYDPSLQIGQTGKVVSPQLYIAVGISGAIQHVAGMTNSKVIVAINKDPDAPIFDIADYGLVGDLYEIVPAFIEELRNR